MERQALIDKISDLLTRPERIAGKKTGVRPYQLDRAIAAIRIIREGRRIEPRWSQKRFERDVDGRILKDALGDSVRVLLREGGWSHSCAMVMATGLGKTRTALAVAGQFRRVLWVTDSTDLRKQTIAYASEKMGLKISVDGQDDGIRVATVQGITSIPKGAYDLIVVDELHKFGSPARKALLLASETPTLGLSATPRRDDGTPMDDIFGDDPVCGAYTLFEGIGDRYLTPFEVKRIRIHELELDSVGLGNKGDFKESKLAEAVNTEEHNRRIVERILLEAVDENGELLCTGVYCVDIDHAEAIAEEFRRQAGDIVACVHSRGGDSLEDYTSGRKRVCVSVSKLTEGFDHPPMRALAIIRPTRSITLYGQMIGRVLRPDWESEHPLARALILDFVGATQRIKLTDVYELTGKDVKEVLRSLTAPTWSEDELYEDTIPLLSEVFTSVERVHVMPAYLRRHLHEDVIDEVRSAAWHRLEWQGAACDVLQIGPKEIIVARPDAGGAVMIEHLRWEAGAAIPNHATDRVHTPSAPMVSRIVYGLPEVAAFEAAEEWMQFRRRNGVDTTDRHAVKKLLKKWLRDRAPPSDTMRSWAEINGFGIPHDVTHGQCVALRRFVMAGQRR